VPEWLIAIDVKTRGIDTWVSVTAESFDFAKAWTALKWYLLSKDDGGSAHELGTGTFVLLAGASGAVVSRSLVVADAGTHFFDCPKSGNHFNLYMDGHFRR
jgi:hypothetical protein